MNVTVCHSHQDRCGIREYGLQLDRSLRSFGVSVTACSYDHVELGRGVDGLAPGSVLLVHFEPGLVHPSYLIQYLMKARSLGARIVFCCHWYEMGYMRQYGPLVDRYVIHRHYDAEEKATVIPLGCPTYDIDRPDKSRERLRERFGLPQDKTILTTIGFLTKWKAVPLATRALLDAVAGRPELFVNIHTPHPFNAFGAEEDEKQIRLMVDGHPQFRFSTQFLPEEDALDLARASDMGFVLHNIHTGSVSAATKQFVSARRPLVITNSSHSSDMARGVLRVGTFDCGTFAREAVALALDRERLHVLQQEMVEEYIRLNMNMVAASYLSLFLSLTQ
jgi:hypothetical protein